MLPPKWRYLTAWLLLLTRQTRSSDTTHINPLILQSLRSTHGIKRVGPPSHERRIYSGPKNSERVLKMFLELKQQNLSKSLLKAVLMHKLKVVKALIDAGADIKHGDDDGNAALHGAAATGDTEIMEYLIDEENADINSGNNDGDTPLLQAIKHEKPLAVEWLVRNGANIKLFNTYGIRPIHMAAAHCGPKIIALLLARGVPINQLGGEDEETTALHVAARYDKADTVCELLRRGATQFPNSEGMTPLDIAKKNGHTGVAHILADSQSCEIQYTPPFVYPIGTRLSPPPKNEISKNQHPTNNLHLKEEVLRQDLITLLP